MQDDRAVPAASVHAPTHRRVRVGLVDDDHCTADWLEASLHRNPRYELIGRSGLLAEAHLLLTAAPDVLLIDIGLPDGSGLDLIAHVQRLGLPVACIVLSVLGDAATVTRAIACGADGYLLKDAEPDQLDQAVASVLAGGAPMSPAIAAHVLASLREQLRRDARDEQGKVPSLTPKERAVLEALARGLAFKEVAQELGISTHTVSDHVKAIYRKLSVRSRAEAVYAAMQAGLVHLRG